jgi:hypothetical protein
VALISNDLFLKGQLLAGDLPSSELVNPDVTQYLQQPPFAICAQLKRLETLKRLQKRVLHQIIRLLTPTAESDRRPVYSVKMR